MKSTLLVLASLMWCTFLAVRPACAQWVEVSSKSSFTITSGSATSAIMTRQSVGSYFEANHITTGYPWPDTGFFQAYGLDPGDCRPYPTPFGAVCVNYRMKCFVQAAKSYAAAPITFNLFDFNALVLGFPGDPPGTCYLTPSQSPFSGLPVLGIAALFVADIQYALQDNIATQGFFNVLSGGTPGTQRWNQNGYMRIVLTMNPRPGDPTSFTFGNDLVYPLSNAFTLTGLSNSQAYPNPVSADPGGVYGRN